jgi:hypothetical protein
MRKRRPTPKVTLEFQRLHRETAKAMLFDSVWIPKSISTVEHDPEHGYAVTVPLWFVDKKNLHDKAIGTGSQTRRVDPDSRAAYSHWNEEADYHYYSEHPEVFGR